MKLTRTAVSVAAILSLLLVLRLANAQSEGEVPAEQRFRAIEDRLTKIESRLASLERAPPKSEQPKRAPDPKARLDTDSPISIKLVSKKFHEGDIMKGDAGDRIEMVLAFTSHLKKDARAFSGTVVFKDLFGDVIMQVGLKHADGLKAGGTVRWEGGIDYNQFLDRHRLLLTTKTKDLQTSFELTQVLYVDGSRENFESPR